MPIPVLGEVYFNGIQSIPFLLPVLKVLPWIALLVLLKTWFGGARNANERVMHGRVAIVTGGTTGIGAAVVADLASRGCQLILLVRDPKDVFTQDYIEDLRERYNNQLIYAEECDLSSLHSVRKFATKFIDNSPPRRVDMVICCAGIMAPPMTAKVLTKDGVEAHWGINYLAHFQLLNILTPTLRVQPPDRNVRVLMATCSSHVLGELDLNDVQFLQRGYPTIRPWRSYGASKMAVMAFACEFQRRMNAHERPDKHPNNVRIFNIDPGLTRTPGMRRWLSLGSIWGLLLYVVTYPFWWLVLKSPEQGAQTFLAAAMSPECGVGEGGKFLRECRGAIYRKTILTTEELGTTLWAFTEQQIKDLEKEAAIKRAKEERAAKKGTKTTDKATTGASKSKIPAIPKMFDPTKPIAPEEEFKFPELESMNDEELKDIVKKAAEARAKKEALDKLIAEEEERDRYNRAIAKLPEGVLDTPSRNTRSRTAEFSGPRIVEVAESAPPEAIPTSSRPSTPSKNRRRTKRA
ncbi:uncharacterized protein LAJ45_04433 [Morchella importuna]|uniref:NAD(P)-binding protein n=1 Tax=Morchella conica CCBAS932 TaxID=1392247 RepID=A0A3N4KV56_9PEZI|nr:uncharacterized protein LAJ45_04433 [Morchella importuna]KAH8151231.1 hypothetical protein LAJ45_04433 [Morchella importuna]RPB14417.1 NAD(P)-binding protein [Morchella conica CCBAS932]